jgi:pimeloyl-ACP methyl ester carboxylesterase
VREGWIERSGVRLHYVEWPPTGAGPAPSVLLLHGLSSNALVWRRLAERLPDRRVVALDQRAHGPSDRPPSGYGAEEIVADAAEAIEVLGLGRPLVAGHSWGAAIALELAALHPDRVSGLVFVDGPAAAMTAFMTWEEVAERLQPPLPRYRDLQEAYRAHAGDLGEAWGDDLEGFVRAGLVVDAEGRFTSTLTESVRLEILRALYAYQPELLFPRVEGPILLALAGRLWAGAPSSLRAWRQRAAEQVRRSRPDAQLRTYDSAHDVPLIAPAALADDVERTAIAAAWYGLAREACRLEGDWARPAQSDQSGWTAKDLLGHLAGTQAAMAGVVSAPPSERPGGSAFDPDRWNASQVARRRGRPPEELMAEMAAGAETLFAALMEVELDRPAAAGPFAGRTVREAMVRMLQHQRTHLDELRQALT